MRFAKIIIFLVLVTAMLPGCITQKRCSRLFPASEIKTDSVNIQKTVVLRDTTVFVSIAPDTVIITEKMPVSVPNIAPVTAENNLSVAKAWIENSVLRVILFNKPGKIAFTLQNKSTAETQYRIKTEIKTVKQPYIPQIYKTALWIVIWQLIMIVGFVVYKFLEIRRN